jgi:glucosylceramidase
MAMSAGTGGDEPPMPALVTSTNGSWATSTWTEAPSATADVTVDETTSFQTWEGFGGAFHEMGWNLLTTSALENEALSLLFGSDGAKLAMARIPIGASDYALERYTLDDTGTDVVPDSGESNRPPADMTLASFSIERDKQTLIPHIKGALARNPKLRFWAVPFTPPVWMKTGYKKDDGAGGAAPPKPSYFDGGTMKSDALTLATYAAYLTRFIQAYAAEGITVDTIAFQFEPTFDQNYPSCLWDASTYTKFVSQYLGSALKTEEIPANLMLGDLANQPKDSDLLAAVMGDAAAKSFVGAIGVEWDVLDKVLKTPLTYGVPVWATEHKCGNYPFITSARAATSTSPAIEAYVEPAPNNQAYAVESWWYIRDAITKAKVTAYNVPHLVLDPMGKGNDSSRDWSQNSLLVVDGGAIKQTQAYYVVRHFSQFVDPGASVIKTTGGDAVAFKNPNGSLVVVLYSAAAKADFTVAIGGKKLQFAVPAGGFATVKVVP